MQSVALTVRDLRPQPIAKAERAAFYRWRGVLEQHWRELAEECAANNRGEATCLSTLSFIDDQFRAIAVEDDKRVELEAGRYWYFLVNVELRRHRIKSQNDDAHWAKRLQKLGLHIKKGYDVVRWPSPFLKLRNELQTAVNQKDEVSHSRILKRWQKAHGA
jgi:hypothetical protein